MKTKAFLITTVALVLIISSCSNSIHPFEISKQHVGALTDSTQVKTLATIFANDSIVSPISGDEFLGTTNTIEVYEKGGKHLLSLTPSQALDSTATISNIVFRDARYKTKKGVNLLSTFADIKTKHNISSIQNTINNVVVFVNENNTYFTIDKKELPSELQFASLSKQIEAIQIPDAAKIKYFMLGW